MPEFGQNPEKQLHLERSQMRAHKRAINWALSQLPVSASPTLSSDFAGATSLLEAVDDYTETLPRYHKLRLARRDISEYIRLHRDVDDFAAVIGASPEMMDDIFRAAMAFEAQGEATTT